MALKFAEPPAERCLPVEVVIGQLLCGHGKQRKHTPWLQDNCECVDSPVHDQVNPPKRLSADESNGVRVLYTAPVKPVNFVRRTESELDCLRASGRDRLQHSSTDQVSLHLIVVPNKVSQSRHGTGAEDHAAQLISIFESTRAIPVGLPAEEIALQCRILTIATSRAPDMLPGP